LTCSSFNFSLICIRIPSVFNSLLMLRTSRSPPRITAIQMCLYIRLRKPTLPHCSPDLHGRYRPCICASTVYSENPMSRTSEPLITTRHIQKAIYCAHSILCYHSVQLLVVGHSYMFVCVNHSLSASIAHWSCDSGACAPAEMSWHNREKGNPVACC